MAGYNVSVASVAAGAAANYCSIQGSTTRPVKIREIGISNNAATSSSVGLGRPANTPVATTSALGQALDPFAPASVCNLNTAWSTAPTIPSVFLRRVVLPATIGAGWIWTFPDDEPLILSPTAGSLQWVTLWNFGAASGSVLQVYVVTKE